MPRAGFLQQLKALIRRNCLLKARNTRRSVGEVLVPVFWILFLALIKWITVGKDVVSPISGFPTSNLDTYPAWIKSLFVVAPNGSTHAAIVDRVQNLTGIPVVLFNSSADAERRYRIMGGDAATDMPFGIVFGDSMYDYTLRTVSEMSVDTSTIVGSLGQCRGDNIACPTDAYDYNGLLFLQSVIDTALLEVAGANPKNSYIYMKQMMPKPSYVPDSSVIRSIAPIYYALVYSFCIQLLVISLVTEKQKKQKEVLKIMGMRDTAFWLSWTLLYAALVLLISSIATVLAVVTDFFRPPSNVFIFFLMLLFYGLSIINLAFVITPFFDNPKVAGPLASLFVALISLLFFVVSQTTKYGPNGEPQSTIPVAVEWLLCLLSPTALAIGIERSLYLDISGTGVTWQSVREGDFPLMAPLIMLAVDAVLYFLLAIYLDNVMASEYGQRRNPFFCLMPSYWRCQSSFPVTDRDGEYDQLQDSVRLEGNYSTLNESASGTAAVSNVEPISSNLKHANQLRILDISKSFQSGKEVTKAVNGISLDVYEGQITALLGHNGAGKTTLLNMLTGLSAPSNGTATVYGLDVRDRNDLDDIRTMTGVCPQQNVLFELLTPREHITLYSDLKGLSARAKTETITTLLSELELTEQADTLARDLSGGQQRKLCVALALVGDPKLIFLDEPSAGLDPKARRGLWSLLKSKKEGRVILLTTHFMDEADILADRKAIISKGVLQCCGSSLYLKTKFGVGYHLNMVVQPGTYQAEQAKQMIQRYVPSATNDQTHGTTVSYVMPQSDVDRFPGLFEALERTSSQGVACSETLGIRSYGISMTTLEEVFLKLGEESDSSQSKDGSTRSKAEGQAAEQQPAVPQQAEGLSNLSKPELVPASVLGRHKLRTLMWLRFMLVKRSKRATAARVILPLVLMLTSMLIVKFVVGSSNGSSAGTPTKLALKPATALGPGVKPMAFVNSTGRDMVQLVTSLENVTGMSVDAFNPSSDLLLKTPHQYGVNVTWLQDANQVNQSIKAVLLYNDTILHSLPVSLNTLSNAMLRMLPNGADKIITTTSYPWPATKVIPQFNVGSFLFAMFIGSALITMLGSFASETVRDRECRARSQLRISGATNALYWGSIFLVDYIQFFGAAIIILVLIAAFQVPALVTGGAMLCIVIYFVLYTPLFLLYSYLYSYLFDKYETCQSTLPPIFSLLNFLPFVATSTLAVITSTTDLANTLHYVFTALDPLYTLSGLFFYITKLYLVAGISQQTNTPDIPFSDYFEWDNGIVVTFIPVILWIPVLCVLIVIADIRKNGGSVSDLCGKAPSTHSFDSTLGHRRLASTSESEDDDVTAERSAVDTLLLSPAQQGTPVVANGLRKEFPKRTVGKTEKGNTAPKIKVAVDNLSFHVAAGEVFGLLGPNGAGKSTVLNMLTAEVAPSAGSVTIGGRNIHSNVSEAYQVMGYCPQYDALWDDLTLSEHLRVYASMRGMTAASVKSASNLFIKALCLEDHQHKEASKLSGGTKRKLSFAMSMIGTPQIVLMDEPSTGMDPQSKRVFWDAIAGSFGRGSERGAILTTHYMEEADALCNRIAIMVNGSLKCIGTSQHLKDKHGSGYMLDVKLHSCSDEGDSVDHEQEHKANKQKLHNYLLQHFPTAAVVESFGDRVSYRINREDIYLLSKSFAALEAAKHVANVSEYSFSQATLEQVFLSFAKQQLEHNDDETAGGNDRDRKDDPVRITSVSINEGGDISNGAMRA